MIFESISSYRLFYHLPMYVWFIHLIGLLFIYYGFKLYSHIRIKKNKSNLPRNNKANKVSIVLLVTLICYLFFYYFVLKKILYISYHHIQMEHLVNLFIFLAIDFLVFRLYFFYRSASGSKKRKYGKYYFRIRFIISTFFICRLIIFFPIAAIVLGYYVSGIKNNIVLDPFIWLGDNNDEPFFLGRNYLKGQSWQQQNDDVEFVYALKPDKGVHKICNRIFKKKIPPTLDKIVNLGRYKKDNVPNSILEIINNSKFEDEVNLNEYLYNNNGDSVNIYMTWLDIIVPIFGKGEKCLVTICSKKKKSESEIKDSIAHFIDFQNNYSKICDSTYKLMAGVDSKWDSAFLDSTTKRYMSRFRELALMK